MAHCEIAGEGIEFDWGFSKMAYRSKQIEQKRNKSKFHELVHSVLGSSVLSLLVCWSNARRARQYMLAYTALAETEKVQDHPTKEGNTANNTKHNTTTQHHNTTNRTNQARNHEDHSLTY